MKPPKDKSVSDLMPQHQARLFPSFGYYDLRQNRWRAVVHGRVFDDGRIPLANRILLRGLQKAMKATPEELASETFRRRIDGFLSAPGKRRKIVLEIAGHHYRLLRRTRGNGSFYGALTLPSEFQPNNGTANVLQMNMRRSTDELGTIVPTSGSIYIVRPQGISVISDIDDTIKMTEATCKKSMLANTFLRPFEVIEGMSQLYQQWKLQGCDFHYVSSSPWQLYEPLAELCETSLFPGGSMHLRYFRVRDEMFKRFRPIRHNSKVGIIVGIFKRLPQRKFILVGDSGEKDPEIYRFLAKRYPDRVAAILIRNLTSKPLSEKRLRKLKSLASPTTVQLFTQATEIADAVDQLASE